MKLKAVLFRSDERFDAFYEKLQQYGIEVKVLDFSHQEWLEYDFSNTDFLIYYPSFKFSSNHPLALWHVKDNLSYLHASYPRIKMFPDPKLLDFYNDKYRQFLYLNQMKYPVLETIPLVSRNAVEEADRRLGYPMVIKNRYGAGGAAVFLVHSRKELDDYFRLSFLDLVHTGALKFYFKMFSKRIFYYHLIKARNCPYMFLSPPLLAQKYVKIQRDLKTVIRAGTIVEGHWRVQANEKMWKMNIDDGGIGEWSFIPQEAIHISEKLAVGLDASWLNIDLIECEGKFHISEFSPVWHHYAYGEKASFVYREDYNVDTPLEISLDLERIIVESLIDAVEQERGS